MEKLFSYGTLQSEKVQLQCFGRILSGHPDILPKYEIKDCAINDKYVIETSGEQIHPIACFTGDAANTVSGMIFDVSPEELLLSDTYEVSDYKRIKCTFGSGIQAWVYVQSGLNIDTTYLQNGPVKLELFQDYHADTLSELALDSRIWQSHRVSYEKSTDFKNTAILDAKANIAKKNRCMFVIYYQNNIVGSTSYYDIKLNHLSMNIGYTWIHPDYWGKGINPAIKQLMLLYAFNQLKFKRIAFNIDADNLRSRAAIEKLHIPLEGILKKHQIRTDGSSRDTAVYAVTDESIHSVHFPPYSRVC